MNKSDLKNLGKGIIEKDSYYINLIGNSALENLGRGIIGKDSYYISVI